MMNYVWSGMIIFSVIHAFLGGGSAALSKAIISAASDAVRLCVTLGGTVCLWSGIMKIAEESGLTRIAARAFYPFLRLVFPRLDAGGKTAEAVSMNVAANLLGLGNAATPFGIEAMKRLKAESGTGDRASADMIKFVVMNSAAFRLIPTAVAALRSEYGCKNPFDVLPACWITSGVSLAVGLTAATIMIKISEGATWKK